MELLEGIVRTDDVDGFLEDLVAIGDEHDVAVQAFDARYVVSREHLRRACELAERAYRRDDSIARDPAVEILLYAAGRRQIERALEMGVSTGGCPAVVVCHAISDSDSGVPDADREAAGTVAVAELPAVDLNPTLGTEDPNRVMEFFDITEAERAATDATLSQLVVERVALLVVEK